MSVMNRFSPLLRRGGFALSLVPLLVLAAHGQQAQKKPVLGSPTPTNGIVFEQAVTDTQIHFPSPLSADFGATWTSPAEVPVVVRVHTHFDHPGDLLTVEEPGAWIAHEQTQGNTDSFFVRNLDGGTHHLIVTLSSHQDLSPDGSFIEVTVLPVTPTPTIQP